MSEDTFRLCAAICLLIIAGAVLGGLVGIGIRLGDVVDALKAAHRCASS